MTKNAENGFPVSENESPVSNILTVRIKFQSFAEVKIVLDHALSKGSLA